MPSLIPPALLARSETALVRAILAYLQTVPGVTAWRNNTGAVTATHQGRTRFVRFGVPGAPDILGWVRESTDVGRVARTLLIEVKRQGQPLRPAQAAFLEAAQRDGALAFVARSVEDVVRELRAVER